MSDLLQILLTAVTVGSLYALIALGYTMVYGILKFINFAHSDIFVLGAWVSFVSATLLVAVLGIEPGASPWWLGGVALILAMGVCALVSFTIERLAYKPLRKAPRLNVLITAIGVSLFLQNFGQLSLIDLGWNTSPVATGTLTPGKRVEALPLGGPLRLADGQEYIAVLKKADGSTRTFTAGDNKERSEVRLAAPSGDYKAGDSLNISEPALDVGVGETFEVRRVVHLRLPFGSRPQRMPAVLPDRALNETTLAQGAVKASETPGNVVLGALLTIDADRQYRLDVAHADGRTENWTIISDPGDYPTGDISVAPVPDAEQLKGLTFRLVRLPKVAIQLVDVAIVGSALVLLIALDILVFRTKLGTAMRAVSYNFETASLMGVPVDRVISFTFVTGAMLAGGAGFLNALKYPGLNIAAHEGWVLLGLKAFVAAVVGGIGNLRGAVLGGFLIAAIEAFGSFYINPALADVYVFSILILVLLLKPTGLLGSPVREKV
jgi:branched-subunit amino acid ABC-type transport system permease component